MLALDMQECHNDDSIGNTSRKGQVRKNHD